MARVKAEAITSDKKLAALAVHPGGKKGHHVIAVGGVGAEGLSLQISPDGRKSWILRAVFPDGKRREMGLGTYPKPVGLTDARDAAIAAKKLIREGRDPIAERQALRDATREAARAEKAATEGPKMMTFREAVRAFCSKEAGQLESLTNTKHKAQWESTLMVYAAGETEPGRQAPRNRKHPEGIGANGIGDKLVADLTKHDIARVLEPIWGTKRETARRVRSRIEAVIRWTDGKEERDRANPAQWSDLKHLGAFTERKGTKQKKLEKRKAHHPALQVGHAQEWFADLRNRPSISARALEFLALTAVRSQEARGACWSEFKGLDGKKPVWTVPAERMKMGDDHRVPLSAQAVALLKALPRHQGTDLVFAAPRGGMLGDMALSKIMKDRHAAQVKAGRVGWLDEHNSKVATPHGLRATFRTWVQEQTTFPRELAEAALAHVSGDEVERAYARGDALARRRVLMQAWADYLNGVEAIREAAE
ncbi:MULTISPECIES: site-specific integrase [Paracoccus]|uniref:tyrosine-type recombinase/integrase n=1 Tax=Paracoccus TaxID=265 RepID=UPI001FB6D268|nr:MULTISPECIES: site-specific integrase [Paracoccus]MCJ1900354.1 integrase arm-type DNA-binding domain-containing protein [Paracoccus versutus]MDF3905527.1 integrase arm-type DNA-binding domain-containing protein [Paracoccus sp. AS002]